MRSLKRAVADALQIRVPPPARCHAPPDAAATPAATPANVGGQGGREGGVRVSMATAQHGTGDDDLDRRAGDLVYQGPLEAGDLVYQGPLEVYVDGAWRGAYFELRKQGVLVETLRGGLAAAAAAGAPVRVDLTGH
jgi:hypothetical protein